MVRIHGRHTPHDPRPLALGQYQDTQTDVFQESHHLQIMAFYIIQDILTIHKLP